MDEYVIEEMNNDDDFQFYKSQLQKDVREYLDIDDQIAALNKAIRDRRKLKTKLSDNILGVMKKFELNDMNTKNGKLIYSVSKVKQPLNKDNIIKGLNNYFNDETKAKEATAVVYSSRQVVEKVKLRRTINKKKPPI